MDVVPAYPEHWSHPPFAAEIDKEGRIFARGAQDMKSYGVQYLAAIRALKKSRKTLERTLHLTYVPDEETDAIYGMKQFVHHDIFKSMNIGFAIDEGMTNENDIHRIFYGERSNWSKFHKRISIHKFFTDNFYFRNCFKVLWSHGTWFNTTERYSW